MDKQQIKELLERVRVAEDMGVEVPISEEEAVDVANFIKDTMEEKNRLLLNVVKAAKNGPIQPIDKAILEIAIHLLKERLF